MSKKLFALLFVMLMLCGAALADGITVTDMHGREIALDQPATRIVALTPSDCEILCAIGCEDALVGRGKYCDYPESISALPVVQSGAETNIEEILALDPQVVLMSDMSQTEEQAKLLEQNGVKVVISDANDIAGVYTAIRMIGALMAKDDAAEALIGDMQATFDEIAAKSEKSGDTAVEEIMGRDGWGDIGAVKNGRVYNADSNAISRPGPRLKDAAIELYHFLNDDEAEEAPAA